MGRRSAAGVSIAAMLQLADVLDTGCLIVDAQMVVRGWNDWLESASGLGAADVVGKPLTDALTLPANAIVVRSLHRALAGESVVLAHQFHEYVLPFPAPAGYPSVDHMLQSARVIPYVFEDGTSGAVALIQDVTERVTREHELIGIKDQAESASKAKSEFLAAMSNELRTPLTAILGYADLLQGEIGGTLSELQHDHVTRIMAGTWHLIRIIDEILSFSRVEAKKYDVQVDPVDVHDIVEQSIAMLQQQAALKGVPIVTDVPDNLVIHTDALKLRQILVNLLGNAVKFTDRGSITIQARADDGELRCHVMDTGTGVPQHMQALIFEPFVQADQSATRSKGGTGLGLALSRGLAELLGGSLVLARTGPEGSEFVLTLPLRSRPGSGDADVRDVNTTVGTL
jgi:signal transduction histidine kinase